MKEFQPSASGLQARPARAVQEQLERILSDGEFAQSERMCRFLRLVVDYSLRDRGAELKEYLIGVEVFDRKPSYDPRIDPIVRVEARRLRSKLRKYYEKPGRSDELIIELPKGTYAAVFRERTSEQPPASPEPPHASPQPSKTTIAVLPFANLSSSEDNEYFSDGLTQELIHGFTRVNGLRVVAWHSASQLKGTAQDVLAIGKQLNVSTVLTGSVRKSGNRLRITAQLIDTATNYYLWSEVYDREVKDLLQIQGEISSAIVSTLRITLADRLGPPTLQRTGYNPEAHNLYLKGRFHGSRRTAEGLFKSVRFFEQSIELDPGFALGWAGLADAYTLLAEYGQLFPADVMPKAKQAATKALELDSTLGEAWASLALIRSLYEWEWEDAEILYRRSMQLNPGYATVHFWFAVDYLAMLGRFSDARDVIKIARQMDPWSTLIIEGQAFIEMLARRYDEAIRIYQEGVDLDPYFYKAFTSIGRALIQKGQYAEAIEMLEKGRALAGDIPNILGALGQAYALSGSPERARALLAQLIESSKTRYTPSTCFAVIHIGLGENEKALDMLEKGCERRELPLTALKVHPAYDCLREEPRFIALLKRLRLLA